jgi:hypothetical protein
MQGDRSEQPNSHQIPMRGQADRSAKNADEVKGAQPDPWRDSIEREGVGGVALDEARRGVRSIVVDKPRGGKELLARFSRVRRRPTCSAMAERLRTEAA